MALANIGTVNGLPRKAGQSNLNGIDVEQARINNSFFLFGASPQFPPAFDDKVIVFLESVYMAAAGTFTIEGTNGVISGAIVAPFEQDHSPVRMDGGVKLNGTIVAAKGYWLPIQ